MNSQVHLLRGEQLLNDKTTTCGKTMKRGKTVIWGKTQKLVILRPRFLRPKNLNRPVR